VTSGTWWTVEDGQRAFLTIVFRDYPAVLAELRAILHTWDTSGPALLRIEPPSAIVILSTESPGRPRWIESTSGLRLAPDLVARLTPWQRVHHLDAPWVLTRAVLDAHGAPLESRIRRLVPLTPNDDPNPFDDESQAAYVARQADAARARYGRGAASPRRRNPQHLEWLARYQVGGESMAAIQRSAGLPDNARTVHQRLRVLATEIDLPLRPAAPRRRRPRR
jgi:hypothetical protein